ncbi:helix-turn-helix domain-containing protein [Bacillus altitudinis]|nr:helix-turn-helix transcriptional regulator [Bacillus altitudinis]WBL53499.1 helix-turn-helix domain-containing protein [Bacillus altitudinis]
MQKRRITQVEAAKHCGCTQSHLSKYFTFECEISREKLNRLVEFVYSRPELVWKKK